jgi:hypothetical protein
MLFPTLALIASRSGSTYPVGTYILGTGTHAVTVRDGTVYDSYDSSGKFRYITILRGIDDAYKPIFADVSAVSADATAATDEQCRKFRKRA